MSLIDDKWKPIKKRVGQIKEENKSKNITTIAKEFNDKSGGGELLAKTYNKL
ncbi:MAG: hypothetical protein JXB50_08205 [Spirochaetes bacterium]|nr:hypothetical protein [Spirochaetota bacterium]